MENIGWILVSCVATLSTVGIIYMALITATKQREKSLQQLEEYDRQLAKKYGLKELHPRPAPDEHPRTGRITFRR